MAAETAKRDRQEADPTISTEARESMPPKRSQAIIAFGGAVRSFRRERGFAQEAFAARAAIDRSYFGAIERGEVNVSLETIVKLADALGISAATLFARAGL